MKGQDKLDKENQHRLANRLPASKNPSKSQKPPKQHKIKSTDTSSKSPQLNKKWKLLPYKQRQLEISTKMVNLTPQAAEKYANRIQKMKYMWEMYCQLEADQRELEEFQKGLEGEVRVLEGVLQRVADAVRREGGSSKGGVQRIQTVLGVRR